MNNARRRRLRALIAACESLRDQLADLYVEEDRAQASLPENLIESPQYIRMDWACIHLDQARAAAETAIAEMAEAMQ